MSFNNVALVYAKGIVYRIPFWYMSKDNATSIMKNSNLADKKGVFWYFFLFIMYKKWVIWLIIRETDTWY